MLNRDINDRFEDWLRNPSEGLDFEVKTWLDMSDVESQGLVAKALIALENHGGGFLLIGYTRDSTNKLVPAPNRPASLKQYQTDEINRIIRGRAEPAFHVQVTMQMHPTTGEEFPLICVPGTSKVPVRSDSQTSGKSLMQHVYYIRAPGPESRGPVNAEEWNTLMRRVMQNQRDEMLGLLRSIFQGTAGSLGEPPPGDKDQLMSFVQASVRRWGGLNTSLPEDHGSKIKHGRYFFAARVLGVSKNIPARDIIAANEAARRYTGWPMFVTLHQPKTKPRLVDGCIEAWLADNQYPDVSHADFWRIDPRGNFFLLRGYQEDGPNFGNPGKLFEATLPMWRLAEYLLRVLDLAEVMFEPGFELLVHCEWSGLEGRKLFVHHMRRDVPGSQAEERVVTTDGRFTAQDIRELLPETVKTLTQRLYEHFEFFVPDDSFYADEIAGMMRNR